MIDVKIDLGDWESSNIVPGAFVRWPQELPTLFAGRRYNFYAMKPLGEKIQKWKVCLHFSRSAITNAQRRRKKV